VKRKKRIALAVIAIASLSAIVVTCLWRTQDIRLSSDEISSILKDRGRLTRNYWEPLRVVGSGGVEWFVPIVRLKDDSRACWHTEAEKRIETSRFAGPEWEFINHQAAAMLPDGRLTVVWSGFDGTQGEKVAVATSDGRSFSPPTILASGVRIRCLDVAVDAKGRIHVLYVSPLEPYEAYGPIEGFFPYKCWHAFHDGQTWTRPEPIQERGRFDIDNAILTLMPSGRLAVSVETHGQFSPGDKRLAVQVLGESGWSKLTKLEE